MSSTAPLSDPHAMLSTVQTHVMSPVFVGRADELDALRAVLESAAEGVPQTVLIGGDAGIGKTRLLEEFLTLAAGSGAATAVGGCVELGADGLPYVPFTTALRSLHTTFGERMDAAVADRKCELAQLLPELGDSGAPDDGESSEHGRARLFELAAQLLSELSADRTLVLALEDLHWSDPSTRLLIAYLTRAMRRGRLVLLLSYRSDDIHRRHPMRPLLAEMERSRAVRHLQLRPFDLDETAALLGGILGSAAEPELAAEVFQRAEGNAYFSEELVSCYGDGCATTELSDSLRDVLLVRVESLPAEAQQVLRVLAEGGSSVGDRLLATVCGLPEDELLAALRASVEAHAVVPTGGAMPGYRFRHALAREVVGDDLLPGERRSLNRRYAEALEADPSLLPAEEYAVRLAGYWYGARDPVRALPAKLEAARQAARRNAYDEQLRLLEHALDMWDEVPEEVRWSLPRGGPGGVYPDCDCSGHPSVGHDEPCTELVDLLAQITVAARLSAAFERGLKVARRAIREVADQPYYRPWKAWFLVETARLLRYLNRSDGIAELTEALGVAEELRPGAVQAFVFSETSGTWLQAGRAEEGLRLAQRAVAVAEQAGAESVVGVAVQRVGALRLLLGDLPGGLADERAGQERARRAGAEFYYSGFRGISDALEAMGSSAEAAAEARRGLELLGEEGLGQVFGPEISGNLAESLISLGDWEEADRLLESNVVRYLAARGEAGRNSHYTWLRAGLQLTRGQPAEAAARLREIERTHGEWSWQPQHQLPLASVRLRIAAAVGELERVRQILVDTMAGRAASAPGMERHLWPMLVHAACAEADTLGLPSAAAGREAALSRIAERAAGLPRRVPVHEAWAGWLCAELARARGQYDPAAWREVAAGFERLGYRYWLAVVRYRLAEALVSTGEREAAVEPLSGAAATARELGARPLADGVWLLAKRARLSLSPTADAGDAADAAGAADDPAESPVLVEKVPDPLTVFGLTARERDVLRLVALGRTNRQIAGELFITPKTASVHVSNILAKLEVAGRGEAAALSHRLRLFPGEDTATV